MILVYKGLYAQRDVAWFKKNDSFIPPKCSITKKHSSEFLGIPITVNEGGPYDVLKTGKGGFITLYVPENSGTNAKTEFPILYEKTDFLKVANEYYRSLGLDQKQVTYETLNHWIDHWPEFITVRKPEKVKGKSGKRVLARGTRVQLVTVYSSKSIQIAHEDDTYEIDPRSTSLIYDIRTLINPEKKYIGNDKTYVKMPQGDRSFADRMVTVHYGRSMDKIEVMKKFEGKAIGPPDSPGKFDNAHLTGCKGLLVLEFVDNVLIDGPGPDLYVFSSGKIFYNMYAYISADGFDWVQLSNVGKGYSSCDIEGCAEPDKAYRFIKLIHDDGCSYRGNFIDAVGAINTRLK